ncbi:hypothetical protein [Streptomyces sp. NPDC059802]|uniref:hypothetical protein n=1 Tax=Streptomyces sp. NPDC059802 TaxID=3346952 RepID=UPI00364D18A9
MPLPRAANGRLVLAVEVSPWLRPDANTCADRSFCHRFGRGEGRHQTVPGRPYSAVAALETGRTSWPAVLDTVRLRPGTDIAAMTTVQIREVVERLVTADQWQEDAPEAQVVLDAGYESPRIAHVAAGLPVEILGRLRSPAVRSSTPRPRRSRAGACGRRASSARRVTGPPSVASSPASSSAETIRSGRAEPCRTWTAKKPRPWQSSLAVCGPWARIG